MDFSRLDLKRLYAFYLVARHGGLRTAAARLRMTVSGVSFSVRRLEEQLDIQLFLRTPNRLVLTSEGNQLAQRAGVIFDGIDEILAGSALDEIHAGHLSIAVNSDLAWYFIPRISAFLKRCPDIELSISIKNSVDALRAVESGEIDMGVGRFGNVLDSIELEPIFESSMSLVMPKNHPLNKSKQIRLTDIAQYKVIISGAWTQHMLHTARIPARGLINAGNCHTASELVAADIGVAIMHSVCTQRSNNSSLSFRDMSRELGKRVFSAAYRKQLGARSTLLKRLRDALLTETPLADASHGREETAAVLPTASIKAAPTRRRRRS